MRFLFKLVITAAALWVATVWIHGINLTTHSTSGKIGTLILVALIFGIINAVLKPVVKTIGCFAYAITLGLISILVNGLLFWLASWVAGKLSLPFHVTGLLPAVLGALLVGIIGWLASLLVDEREGRKR
ncbi:MAG TPA: phage holin family protein [Streptosporangiaceae bacterium]